MWVPQCTGVGLIFSLEHFVESLEDFHGHVGGQVPKLAVLLLHVPIRRDASVGLGLGLVLTDLLVVAEQVIPLVIALVRASQAPVAPAVVLHPLPPQLPFHRRGLRRGRARLVPTVLVQLLCGDQDQRLLDGPVPFAVLAHQRR